MHSIETNSFFPDPSKVIERKASKSIRLPRRAHYYRRMRIVLSSGNRWTWALCSSIEFIEFIIASNEWPLVRCSRIILGQYVLSTAVRLYWNQWVLCNPYSVFLLIGLVAGILVYYTQWPPVGHIYHIFQHVCKCGHSPSFCDIVFSFSLIAHFVRLLFFPMAKPSTMCYFFGQAVQYVFWHNRF